MLKILGNIENTLPRCDMVPNNPLLERITIYNIKFLLALGSYSHHFYQKFIVDWGHPKTIPPNFKIMLLSYYILWKEHGMEFNLAKFCSLYYLYFIRGGWFSLRPYDNHMFFDDFTKSNKGWHLLWFITTSVIMVLILTWSYTHKICSQQLVISEVTLLFCFFMLTFSLFGFSIMEDTQIWQRDARFH